jgi:hypothetical protein
VTSCEIHGGQSVTGQVLLQAETIFVLTFITLVLSIFRSVSRIKAKF